MSQLNIFELTKPTYKIIKPIRLIELFAGIGSQAQALKNIKVDFEHYKIIEFDKYAVASYNAIHNTNFETLDITKINHKDLGIVETNKYEYIMTYSFPCQDISLAGKRQGLDKGDNTRSGLLWEVERLLDTTKELPQILLMENVPQLLSNKDIGNFRKWQLKLEQMGYTNYTEVLNAKDYEIPQNRERVFMISILGDYYYEFPKKIKLQFRLKDMLEKEVDEKYFLSEKLLKCFRNTENKNGFIRAETFRPHNENSKHAWTITTCAGNRSTDNYIIVPEATKQGYAEARDGDGVYIDRPHQKRGVVQKGIIQTLKTSGNDVGVVVNAKQKLCNALISNGHLQEDDMISHSYTDKRMKNLDRKENENGISVTLTTRPDTLGVVVTDNYSPSKHKEGIAYNDLRIRKLTPKECWRLMGFSDDSFDKAQKVNSNAQLYKQAGNSIVVNVLEKIFKQLF